mgnify:CR=1 FL=1
MIEQIGLNEAKEAFAELPVKLRSALIASINNVVPNAHSLAVEKITEQVALTKGYVKSRLYISQRASNTDPMAVISGRVRSTQLRRYGGKQLFSAAKLPGKRRLAGTSVGVKTGGSQQVLKHAWIIKLKYGEQSAGAGLTMGIAQRTGSGRDDYRILYGPSVDQVFRDVKDEIRPDVEQLLADEWLKQMRGLV